MLKPQTTKEMQMKTTVRCHFIPTSKTKENNKCCQGCGETGIPVLCL